MSTGIAVIVVNYGTADLAIAAVDSVLARAAPEVEIHLVDNASPGGDALRLAAAHEARGWGARVRLRAETRNHGFGRANNLVLEHLAARPAPPDKVFLLNPDARLDNDAIAILSDALDAHPRTGFAGAGISKPGDIPVTAAFRFPSPFGEFVRQASLGPIARAFPNRIMPLPPDHPEGPVDWVAGAAVMMRFSAIRDLGFFDPDYFLYFEEVDLMKRAARAGWETRYVPRARVIHAEGQATNVRSGDSTCPRRPGYWYDSWRTYFGKIHGPLGLRLAALSWIAGAAVNKAAGLLPGRTASVPDRFFSDFGQGVLRPLLGLEPGRRV